MLSRPVYCSAQIFLPNELIIRKRVTHFDIIILDEYVTVQLIHQPINHHFWFWVYGQHYLQTQEGQDHEYKNND